MRWPSQLPNRFLRSIVVRRLEYFMQLFSTGLAAVDNAKGYQTPVAALPDEPDFPPRQRNFTDSSARRASRSRPNTGAGAKQFGATFGRAKLLFNADAFGGAAEAPGRG